MSLVRDHDHLSEILDIPFTDAQMAAITAPLDGPSAIVAGAGSGKTTVMAARVVWLVGHLGVRPERVLGLTFTTKAAGELGQRIRASLALLGVDPAALEWGDPTASTYHAFAGQLIAEHGLRLAIEPDLRLVADASAFQRFARAVETYPGSLHHVTTHVPYLVRELPRLDGELSEHLCTAERLRAFDAEVLAATEQSTAKVCAKIAKTARKRTEYSLLVDAYRAAKRADGVMDFSDQMAAGAMLARHPEVRASLRERYDVVLLDEYQDTSVAQRDLLVDLFAGLPVTAVGDPAQSIYSFRGAASGNLESFLSDFCVDDQQGRRYALSQTRRCRPEIIDVANMVAAPFYATSSVVSPLSSAREPGGRVEAALHATVADEIAWVVQQVRTVHERGVAWKDVAILVRQAAENGEIVKALREAGVPFEIVGLQGLLGQPEVMDVLSVLEVVDDATANPAALRLLTGPRFAIGARDLALLGRRAVRLARTWTEEESEPSLESELARAVEGTDPTDVVSLADALEDLGDDLPYSPEARARFTELAGLLATLRAYASEPLLDLARRAVRAIGLDIELDVQGGVAGDNLVLFLDAVAAYSETDRYASLSGLVAYLRAEEAYNSGMEVSTPTEADSVKLLTVHKSKGLEWHTVFVPFLADTVFPSAKGRPNWLTNALALPSPLRGDRDSLPWFPSPDSWAQVDLDELDKAHRDDGKQHAAMEELRLAYVAFTRAADDLVVSGHHWGRTQLAPRGPSPFLRQVREWLAERDHEPLVWAEEPEAGASNPLIDAAERSPWPAALPSMEGRRALAERVQVHLAGAAETVDPIEHAELDALAEDIELLLAEAEDAAQDHRTVPLPDTVSATSVLALAGDAEEFARGLARPMPRRPSLAARFGTRFHAWIEARYQQPVLIDPTDLPGRGDSGIDSDAEFDRIVQLFEAGPYADRTPVAIEAPFSIVLAGQQVIGRIDAVFATDDGGFEVVDWKTNARATADPLQLAVYRLAWAELRGIDPVSVVGAFHYVRLGETVRFVDLPGREELEQLLTGEGQDDSTPAARAGSA